MEIMILDSYGPTLEELFRQAGRSFSIATLFLLGCQMISRVQFMHSRGIIHGNLSPSAFAVGQKEWQADQVILVDYSTKTNAPTVHDDLHAVGCILSYFYHKGNTWEEYSQSGPLLGTLPALELFFARVSSSGCPDYSSLRGAFVGAYHDSIVQPGPYPSLAIPWGVDLMCAPASSTLLHNLDLTLSAIGKSIDIPHNLAVLEDFLAMVDNMFQIYKTLLLRDKPSLRKRSQITGAYYLPNRLWRDLRWLIKRMAAQKDLRYAVFPRVYHLLCVLHDMVPSYQIYWTEYLSNVAREWANMDSSRRQDCTRITLYWDGIQNELKAAEALVAIRNLK
jgi:serine/threonine protein kinase